MSIFNILYSTFTFKCPRCNKGKLYLDSDLYNLKKVDKMHEECSHCHLKFEREVGFFYGAMYVAYGLVVAVFIITYLSYLFWWHKYFSELVYATFLSLFYIIFAPFTLRYSRALWLNIFVKFEKSYA